MSIAPIRPRFRRHLAATADAAIARVHETIERTDRGYAQRVLGHHLDVTVGQDERHAWSPCVQLEFVEESGGTEVYGLIGPHPNVWTLFAFVYGTLATATCFAIMLGFAQVMLGESPWGFWLVPLGVVLVVAMYVASQIGQRFAADQTRALSDVVLEALALENAPGDADGPQAARTV